jgi:hypothetical protein
MVKITVLDSLPFRVRSRFSRYPRISYGAIQVQPLQGFKIFKSPQLFLSNLFRILLILTGVIPKYVAI